MTRPDLQERMTEARLRLPDSDLAAFGEMVTDMARIAAWLRSADLSYADEPAICFRAPRA